MALLSPEQIDFFRRHGWLVLRGAVPRGEVEALTGEFDRILPTANAGPRAATPTQPTLPAMMELPGASAKSAIIARHTFNPTLAECVAELLDTPRVQLLQDTMMIKPPRSQGRVEWHQDHTYLAYLDRASSVSLRLSLTGSTAEMGCLQIVDGSHAWGLVGGTRVWTTRVTDASRHLLPEWNQQLTAQAHPVELDAGDVSIHHCLTFHGSLENRSDRPRKTLISRIVDGRSLVVPERLPHPAAAAHFPVDDAGRLRSDAFPVLYDTGC